MTAEHAVVKVAPALFVAEDAVGAGAVGVGRQRRLRSLVRGGRRAARGFARARGVTLIIEQAAEAERPRRDGLEAVVDAVDALKEVELRRGGEQCT